jgi:hypothetical protein
MIIRNLDKNGDWTFGSGKADYIDGNAAIELNIRTRLYSWVGDCFFDTAAGIDWYNRLGSKNQRALLELDLRRIILQSYGVTGIVTFSSNLDSITRRFSAQYSIDTIYSKNYIAQIMNLTPTQLTNPTTSQ